MSPIETLAVLARPVLEIPFIKRIRRNHGLEHATIHLLARGRQRFQMAGRSTHRGFLLYGEVTTEEVERAVGEALRRMKAGEHQLALHPNCGTNLVTTGALTALAAMTGAMGAGHGWRDRLERFPTVMLMMIGALIVSQPLGMALQRHFTTLGDPGDLVVTGITRHEITTLVGNQITVHRVETA